MGDPKAEQVINDVISYIPQEERPDMTALINYYSEQMKSPVITEWNSFRFWPRFNAETAKFAFSMAYKPSDVIVASFPKTGTTWVRHIVHHLTFGGNAQWMKLSSKLNMTMIYLETGLPLKFPVLDKLPLPRRVFGTHLNAQLVNLDEIKKSGAKVIYCIRNPKDQAVSQYHMLLQYPFKDHPSFGRYIPQNWDDFFEIYTSGEQPLCTRLGEWYPDHLMSWYPYRDSEHVLFVVYEEMHKNPVKEIQRIADFLNVTVTPDRVKQIAEMTSFKKMSTGLNKDQSIKNFFRKGEVGDWKNYFSESQSEAMDKLIQEKLGSTDIKFIYDL